MLNVQAVKAEARPSVRAMQTQVSIDLDYARLLKGFGLCIRRGPHQFEPPLQRQERTLSWRVSVSVRVSMLRLKMLSSSRQVSSVISG